MKEGVALGDRVQQTDVQTIKILSLLSVLIGRAGQVSGYGTRPTFH